MECHGLREANGGIDDTIAEKDMIESERSA